MATFLKWQDDYPSCSRVTRTGCQSCRHLSTQIRHPTFSWRPPMPVTDQRCATAATADRCYPADAQLDTSCRSRAPSTILGMTAVIPNTDEGLG